MILHRSLTMLFGFILSCYSLIAATVRVDSGLQHRGEIIYESAAILMYLLDQHPDVGLAHVLHSPPRGHYYQNFTWMSNTLWKQLTTNRRGGALTLFLFEAWLDADR